MKNVNFGHSAHGFTIIAICKPKYSKEKNMLPNFVIMGAMKGGTTSLHRYIAAHPEFVPSNPKETDFFKSESTFKKGVDWYESLFKGEGSFAFETSPNYTKRHIFPGVPERMHSILPNVKLIYTLRDPIERIISHYTHNYSQNREKKSISDVIKNTQNNYLLTSKYYFQISAFLEYYPKENIHLIESERLRNETSLVLQEIFAFLDVTAELNNDIIEKRFHVSSEKQRKSSLERYLMSKTSNRYLTAAIRAFTAPARKPVTKPVLAQSARELLSEELTDDVQKLRQFSGLQFSSWSV